MTIMVMLEQSAILTVLGMGVVFGFLIIMVICVSAMGKIIQGLGNKGAAQTGAPSQADTADAGKSTAVTAAITAAVTQYQKDNS